MVSVTVVRNVVGIIGNVISFGLFLSPSPTFYKIWKKGAVEDFSPIPYLATVLNCIMWIFYGLPIVHPHSTLVYTINGIGLVIECIYLTLYFVYSTKQQKVAEWQLFFGQYRQAARIEVKPLLYLAVEIVFMAIVVAVNLLALHTHERRTMVVGILCIIFGAIMYASPLSVMRMVIRTKSVEYMPFYLSLASFLNGVCWTIYALMPLDVNMIIPNGLGTLLAVVQLILYACYYRTTPRKGKGGNQNPELELPTTQSPADSRVTPTNAFDMRSQVLRV